MFTNIFESDQDNNKINNNNNNNNVDNRYNSTPPDENRKREINSLFSDDHLKYDIVIPSKNTTEDGKRVRGLNLKQNSNKNIENKIEKKRTVEIDDLDEILI